MLNAKNAKMRALKNQSRWFSKALKSIRMDGNPMTMYIGEILPEVRNQLEEKGWKIITKEAEVRGLDLNLITCSSIKLSEEEIKESLLDDETEQDIDQKIDISSFLNFLAYYDSQEDDDDDEESDDDGRWRFGNRFN